MISLIKTFEQIRLELIKYEGNSFKRKTHKKLISITLHFVIHILIDIIKETIQLYISFKY